jgi:hypothetical protein
MRRDWNESEICHLFFLTKILMILKGKVFLNFIKDQFRRDG